MHRIQIAAYNPITGEFRLMTDAPLGRLSSGLAATFLRSIGINPEEWRYIMSEDAITVGECSRLFY